VSIFNQNLSNLSNIGFIFFVNILLAALSACVPIIDLVPIHHNADVGDLITCLSGVFCIIGVSNNTSVVSLGFTFVTPAL